MDIHQKTRELLATLCRDNILSKIWTGAGYGAAAYIYRPQSIADMELTSPQCLLLALLHSLVQGDVLSSCVLADVCYQVQQLRSRHLKVWLREDFVFPRQDIEKAITVLSKLLATGVLKLPLHVIKIMSSLATMYGIHDVQLISPNLEGDGYLANLLENSAIVSGSSGDTALTTGGGAENRSTHPENGLLHLTVSCGSSAGLEAVNSSYATTLEEAVKNNCASSVKAQLISGAKLNQRLFRGDTYLHIAAAGSHNTALEALMESGLEINNMNHIGETALFQAVRAGNVTGVEMLMAKGASANILPKGGKNLLEIAIESKQVKMVRALIDQDVDAQDNRGTSALMIALKKSEENIATFLLHNGASPRIKDNRGRTPLHFAVEGDCTESVATLLDAGAIVDDIDIEGDTALTTALKNSKEDIATLLLHNGASPRIKDDRWRTPLHFAAEGGSVRLVMTLLDAGASVNDKDITGGSPALVAAVNNNPSVLKLLVESGADLTLKDRNGNGIIHLAATRGHAEVVRLLLEAGVVVDTRGYRNQTALHYAADEGHAEVVTVLLDRGADPAAKDRDGNKPPILPCQRRN